MLCFQDGRQEPRGGRLDRRLPNPRAMSKKNHPDENKPDTRYTHMVMQFGQFLDHDLTLTPEQELHCCDDAVLTEDEGNTQDLRFCFNIDVKNDIFYKSLDVKCLPFTRSDSICSRNGVREQFNAITAFVDASNVYGSDETSSNRLRGEDGKLKVNEDFKKELLPKSLDDNDEIMVSDSLTVQDKM